MPDPPRRLVLVHGDSRHEAAMVDAIAKRVDPAAQYGLPLLRARSAFVPPALWKAALVASHARNSPGYSDEVLGTPWRYEVFAVPYDAPRDTWSSWDRQQASPELRAEVDRQSTFFAASVELGRRLLAGELQGWGRLGSLVGPWTEIPAEAWHVLRVPYEPGFGGWQRGHLSGAGMELWGARILDNTGLPLRAAALAYGSGDAVSVAQRGMVFGHSKPTTQPRPKSLAARMAAAGIPQVGPATRPQAAELVEAIRNLRRGVIQQLQGGSLVAEGESRAGVRQPIDSRAWASGRADFGASALTTGTLRFDAIRIRKPFQTSSPDKIAPQVAVECRDDRPAFCSADVQEWFKRRVEYYSGDARHPSEKADQVAANTKFNSDIPRQMIRSLRDQYVAAARRRQGWTRG